LPDQEFAERMLKICTPQFKAKVENNTFPSLQSKVFSQAFLRRLSISKKGKACEEDNLILKKRKKGEKSNLK
jgi:hypothetical protein